jgi:hypothetical protein
LTEFFHLNHQITGAYWDEERGLWDVHVKNILDGSTFIDSAEVFINCGGILKSVELIQSTILLQKLINVAHGNGPKLKASPTSRVNCVIQLHMTSLSILLENVLRFLVLVVAESKLFPASLGRSLSFIPG